MAFTDVHELKLTEADNKALADIKEKLDAGRVMSVALAILPLLEIFSGNAVGAVVTILSTDWKRWAKGLKDIPQTARDAARNVAYQQKNVSDIKNNRKAKQFWANMEVSLR